MPRGLRASVVKWFSVPLSPRRHGEHGELLMGQGVNAMKSTSRFVFLLVVIIISPYLAQAQAIVEGTASSTPALDNRTGSAGSSSLSSRKSGNESNPVIADPLVRVLMSKGLLTSEE